MNVLMCCSDLTVKGGMVSVVRNYLSSPDWGDVDIFFVPTHTTGGKLRLAAMFAQACVRILPLAAAGQFDVAHLHVAERGSFIRKGLLVRMLHRLGVKTVLHHHGAEFEEYYASASSRHKRFIRRTLELADVNIVLSRRLIPMVLDKAPDARVEVVYNAVKVPPSNPYTTTDNNRDAVLFLGRLGHRKGTYDLLEAIKRLDKILPLRIRFLLCGDGEVNEVMSRCKDLGISHRIDHTGWVDGKLKEEFMRRSMINVLPSYNEGLPMTILETMAHGIPNISTRIASIPEVITDGETGLLIEPGDIDALTRALSGLILSPRQRLDISQASYRLVAKGFSLPSTINTLKNIYRSLLPAKLCARREET